MGDPDSRPDGAAGAGDCGPLLLDEHFAAVPEWLLDSPIGDCAVRLYAVLLRYGQTSGARMPSRATLARRLRKSSVHTVDRAMKELAACGAVVVERRSQGGVSQTNRYHVRTRRPAASAAGGGRSDAAPRPAGHDPGSGGVPPAAISSAGRVAAGAGGERMLPATPTAANPERISGRGGGRIRAARGRSPAASPAAAVRPNPESFTQTQPPPQPPALGAGAVGEAIETARRPVLTDLEARQLQPVLAAVGLSDVDALSQLADACRRLRAQAGQPAGRWTVRCLAAGLQLAVQRGFDPARTVPALLLVAADAVTRSPMRLAETGPWWDPPAAGTHQLRRTRQEDLELTRLEALLADRDDRAQLQAQARTRLQQAGEPVSRLSVARLAARLASTSEAAASPTPVPGRATDGDPHHKQPRLQLAPAS